MREGTSALHTNKGKDQKETYGFLYNIWIWLGFSQKAMAKRSLEKYFIIDKDYKVLLNQQAKQTNDTKGGHNKQIILLNIRTFFFYLKKTFEKTLISLPYS